MKPTFPLVDPVRVDRTIPSEYATFPAWVPFEEGLAVLSAMARLLGRESAGRPLGIALSADPNSGKSHLLDHFADSYPDLEDVPAIQVLLVETPSKADGSSLLRALLRRMGVKFNERSAPDLLLEKLLLRLKVQRVRLIIIDEITNGNWGRRDAAVTLLQTVKSIMNRSGRPVVVAGTDKLDTLLRNDDQLNERFRRMKLNTLKDFQVLADFVATFEPVLDMPQPSNLATQTTTELILSFSNGGSAGRVATLLREAAVIAKEASQPRIVPADIEAAAEALGYEKK